MVHMFKCRGYFYAVPERYLRKPRFPVNNYPDV